MPAPLELSRPETTTPREEPRPDTRVQTIPLPPRPWTKIIAAFAGGVACTFVLTTFITFSSTPSKPKTEVGIGKAAQRTPGAQPAKSEPTPPPAAKASDAKASDAESHTPEAATDQIGRAYV